MLTKDKAADIFNRIRKHSTADEVEAMIYGGKFALTRFANNTIHQNVAEENYSVSVRTAFGGRTARATTNKFDNESLKRVVQASESLAKVQHPDPDLLPMPDAGESPATTQPDPAGILRRPLRSLLSCARRRSRKLCGWRTGTSSPPPESFLLPNRWRESSIRADCSDWHTQTSSEISITMLAADSSGWQKANSPDVSQLDPAALAEISARKAIESASPREIPPGKYTVILEPAAVLDMSGFMFWDFGGLSILDQRSFLNQRVGTQIFGANINIWDDVAHPLQSGTPFDGEGVPRQRVQLVENGVVKRLVYARATAEKMKKSEFKDKVGPVAATGHGFSLPNEMGEAPMNIVFGTPSDPQTVEQMIASTERGVLVTRLWYIREVDPYEKILTGMTRDGTFYVEDGKVRHGILNFRFNESLIHMLSNVEAMGTPVRASGEESFDMVAPPMKVKDFNFTEVTKF